MKLGHSILFVPASDTAIVLNSFIYDVDAIMFDLEDCVALCEKILRILFFLMHNKSPLPKYRNLGTCKTLLIIKLDDVNAVVTAGTKVIRKTMPLKMLLI